MNVSFNKAFRSWTLSVYHFWPSGDQTLVRCSPLNAFPCFSHFHSKLLIFLDKAYKLVKLGRKILIINQVAIFERASLGNKLNSETNRLEVIYTFKR